MVFFRAYAVGADVPRLNPAFVSGCGREPNKSASLPENAALTSQLCARAPEALDDWERRGEGPLNVWLNQYSILLKTASVEQKYLVQFAFEFAKIPRELRIKLVGGNGRTHLIQGNGVPEDPTWDSLESTTSDGRLWSSLPGSGGMPTYGVPTRIVVNRIYEGTGAVNLVLHEHAHAIDSLSSYNGISNSKEWKQLFANNIQFKRFLGEICGSYCAESSSEAFAETFAFYYACEATRQTLQSRVLEIAEFMKHLPSKNLYTLD